MHTHQRNEKYSGLDPKSKEFLDAKEQLMTNEQFLLQTLGRGRRERVVVSRVWRRPFCRTILHTKLLLSDMVLLSP